MWACARGKLDAAAVLYKWRPGCLTTPNRDGQHPLAVARMMGHSNVAQALEYLEAERQRQQLAQQNRQHSHQQQLKELHISTTLVQSQSQVKLELLAFVKLSRDYFQSAIYNSSKTAHIASCHDFFLPDKIGSLG